MIDVSVLASQPNTLGWPDAVSIIFTALLSGLAAVAGAVVAGRYTREAATQQITAANDAQRLADEAEVQGFLKTIRVELETSIERYEAQAAAPIRAVDQGEYLAFEWPIRHNYLVAYDANARLLGRVPDPETRRLIVRIYTHIKGLLDSLSMNTDMLRELARSEEGVAAGHIHLAPYHHLRRAQVEQLLIAYAQGIRNLDTLVMESWRALRPRLPAD